MSAPSGLYRKATTSPSGYTSPGRYRATGEFRPPKAGEWFLSGAIAEAYQAKQDVSYSYWIVEPVQTSFPNR